MSQEGANLPQEVQGSHDQATAPHESIPAGVGLPMATPADSNSSPIRRQASAINNTGSSELANPIVRCACEDSNAASKITSLVVVQAGEDSNTASELASLAVLLAGERNKGEFKIASPAALRAGEEKGNDAARSKLAMPEMLHDCDNNKARSHAGMDNDAVRSKLASPTVLDAGDGNSGRSMITLPNPTVVHGSKDMDNNFEWPNLTSPVLLHAGEENKATAKLAIQEMSHAGGNAGISRFTRSAAAVALHATEDNTSKLSIQVLPRPHLSKDNDARSSKEATRPAAVDADESNAKEGKNNIAGEQQPAHDVDGGSGKGNAAVLEDVDPNLHIFTERERRKKMKNMFSTLHALLPQLPDKADKATIVEETMIYIKTLEDTVQKLEKLKQECKHALAAQQHELVVVGVGSSRTSSARHDTVPALPTPAPASSYREANLVDMVQGREAQLAAVAAANKGLAAGLGGSSCSSTALPHGTVAFPAPTSVFKTWSGHNVVLSVANNEAYINMHCPREPGMLTKALLVLDRHRIEVVTTTISTQDGFHMYGIHARANPASALARFPENLCVEERFKLAVSDMVQLLNI